MIYIVVYAESKRRLCSSKERKPGFGLHAMAQAVGVGDWTRLVIICRINIVDDAGRMRQGNEAELMTDRSEIPVRFDSRSALCWHIFQPATCIWPSPFQKPDLLFFLKNSLVPNLSLLPRCRVVARIQMGLRDRAKTGSARQRVAQHV